MKQQIRHYNIVLFHITLHINKTFDLYCEVCVKIAKLSDNTTCLRDCHKVATWLPY